jgi:hypothetical protein
MESIMQGLQFEADLVSSGRREQFHIMSAPQRDFGSPFDHGTPIGAEPVRGAHPLDIVGRLSELAAQTMRRHGDPTYEHPREAILEADPAVHRTW